MFDSLSKIANIKSDLREQTELYFQQIINELDSTELYLSDKLLRISEIAIEPKVITTKRKFERSGNNDRDAQRNISTISEIQLEYYERISEADTYEQISWRNALEKEKLRLIVKGDPGGGKSFMTKYTAIKIARESIRKLHGFESFTENIEFPIWLTANDLAEFSRQKSIDENLINLMRHRKANLSEGFFAHLGGLMKNAGYRNKTRFFIFIDGLDELYNENYDAFTAAAQQLGDFQARIIVACRQFQWRAMQGLLKWNEYTEVTLAPFKGAEQKNVIDNYFSHQPELKNSLKKLAEANYALQSSFASPLLLTFACLLHQTGDLNENTTQINLYEMMIAKLFDGTYCPSDRKPGWTRRNKDDHLNPGDKTEILLALFDELGWQLFQNYPSSKEFSLAEWNAAYNKALKVIKRSFPQITEINDSLKQFRDELIKIRLLTLTGMQNGKLRWSYLHRTILEFSSARALSMRKNWLKEAKKHFWDTAWLEHLTFLAGEAEDVRPLISAVKAEEDDIFGSMTLLEAKFTGVSKLSKATDIKSICDRIIYGLQNQYENEMLNRDRPFGKIERPPDSIGSTIYSEFLQVSYLALTLNPHCRQYFSVILFQPIINVLQNYVDEPPAPVETTGDEQADNVIKVPSLKFPTENENLRQLAIVTLSKLGYASKEVISALILTLRNDPYRGIRKRAAEVLGDLGYASEEVVNALTETMNDSEDAQDYSRSPAAIALLKFGNTSDEITSGLIRTIQNDTNGYGGGSDAVQALIRHGNVSEENLEILIDTLENTGSDDVRRLIIWTLSELGYKSDRVINVLANLLFYEDYFRIRQYSAMALAKLGVDTPEVVPRLSFILNNDYEGWSCEASANALGELGNTLEEAVWALINTLNNESESSQMVYVTPDNLAGDERKLQDNLTLARKLAAISLVSFGHGSEEVKAKAVNVLLDILKNEDEPFWVREGAAEAFAVSGFTTEEVIPVLINSIYRDDSNRVRESAAVSLGKSGNTSDEVILALISGMEDDPFVSMNRNSSAALSKICCKIKEQDVKASSWIIRKLCLRLNKDSYVLHPDFASPLFIIWREFCQTFPDFKINRAWLED